MSSEQVLSLVSFVILAALFVRGYRAAREIDRIYKTDDSNPPSLILETIRNGVFIKVVAAGWIGRASCRERV